MRLSEFLEPELVLLDLRSRGVQDTIEALTGHLIRAGRLLEPDAAGVIGALMEREASHSTSLGNGIALPHATLPTVDHPVVLVAVAPAGVAFGPDGSELVRLFFLLLSPLSEAGTHIKLLARIVRLVRRPGLVPSLLEAESGDDVVDAIARVDALHV